VFGTRYVPCTCVIFYYRYTGTLKYSFVDFLSAV
jgi:hypothetical protein